MKVYSVISLLLFCLTVIGCYPQEADISIPVSQSIIEQGRETFLVRRCFFPVIFSKLNQAIRVDSTQIEFSDFKIKEDTLWLNYLFQIEGLGEKMTARNIGVVGMTLPDREIFFSNYDPMEFWFATIPPTFREFEEIHPMSQTTLDLEEEYDIFLKTKGYNFEIEDSNLCSELASNYLINYY